MQTAPDGFTLRIVNDVSEIARVTTRLQSFGLAHGLPETIVDNVALAIDELVSNIIQHGLPPGSRETISLRVALAAGALTLEISDPGRPFDPLREVPAPDLDSPLEQRRIGGLGVHLVRSLMDKVSYRRRAGRNVLTLSKSLPAPPPP